MSNSVVKRILWGVVLVVLVYAAWHFLGVGGAAEPPSGPTVEAESGDVWRVTQVYDGDTFVVSRGGVSEEVRMIGIDTPEREQCGYSEAADYLRGRIAGEDVTLIAGATTDRDNYDRLLRYVEVDGEDLGLSLIESGLAHARYDSRSGKPHPREDDYRDADDAYRHICD